MRKHIRWGLRKKQTQWCPEQAGDRGRDGFRTRNTGLKETACVEQSDGKKSREGYSRREGYGIPRSVI